LFPILMWHFYLFILFFYFFLS